MTDEEEKIHGPHSSRKKLNRNAIPLERITHLFFGSISIDDRVGARSGVVAGSRDGSRHRRGHAV